MKGTRSRIRNKNVVGNDRVNDDASIEEMQMDAAAAAGLVEVPGAGIGTAGEDSKSPAGLHPSPAPAEGEDAPDPLAALLAAQVKPTAVGADVQQSAGEQVAPQDGAEVAAPALQQVRLTEQEQIGRCNSTYAADAKQRFAETERAKQREEQDRMDYDQAVWYEAGGQQRTGPGVGCGLFDSDLTCTDLQADRWDRNYRDVDPQGQKRWTVATENMWK